MPPPNHNFHSLDSLLSLCLSVSLSVSLSPTDALEDIGVRAREQWRARLRTERHMQLTLSTDRIAARRLFTVISAKTASAAAWGASFAHQMALVFARSVLLTARSWPKFAKECVVPTRTLDLWFGWHWLLIFSVCSFLRIVVSIAVSAIVGVPPSRSLHLH